MFYFTIGAIFKNESHILEEWIMHYKNHGIDHIYLINDNSTDEFMEKLVPFIEEHYVTLYNATDTTKKLGMQSHKYNEFFRQHLNETRWFGIVDLDEFLYSPKSKNLKEILLVHENYDQLQIQWVHYGSSGYIEQPVCVVDSFLMRGEYNAITNGPNGRYNSYKSILQCNYNDSFKLGIHEHVSKVSLKIRRFELEENELLINHYATQSKNFWEQIKMTRGDADCYYDRQKWSRDLKLFDECNIGITIRDERLLIQNNTS
jgi:hypothetical protein